MVRIDRTSYFLKKYLMSIVSAYCIHQNYDTWIFLTHHLEDFLHHYDTFQTVFSLFD
jgi:hypothetical protein